MIVPFCAYTPCGEPFAPAPKARHQRFCSALCRWHDWMARNPRPKKLASIYNRTYYEKNRDDILRKKGKVSRCECGNRKNKQATECRRCKAMPNAVQFLPVESQGRRKNAK